METPTTTTPAVKTNWLKLGLAWAFSLLVLFVLIYVISMAWKKGQVSAAA